MDSQKRNHCPAEAQWGNHLHELKQTKWDGFSPNTFNHETRVNQQKQLQWLQQFNTQFPSMSAFPFFRGWASGWWQISTASMLWPTTHLASVDLGQRGPDAWPVPARFCFRFVLMPWIGSLGVSFHHWVIVPDPIPVSVSSLNQDEKATKTSHFNLRPGERVELCKEKSVDFADWKLEREFNDSFL